MKILLVDDSRIQRLVIQKDLNKVGYSVVTAADGEEGIRRAAEESPDLILLDMMLPKISGLEVLRKLKTNSATSNIPVVVLTALSKANEEKLKAEGAAGFCEKSDISFQNDCALLIEAVKRAVRKR